MARAKTIGSRSFQTIGKHTRKIVSGGQIQKQSVRAHTRFNRWWGAAGPIPLKVFLSFSLRVKFRRGRRYNIKNFKLSAIVRNALPKSNEKAINMILRMYQQLTSIMTVGIAMGNQTFTEKHLQIVASNSGELRKDVQKSLLKNQSGRHRFPIRVKIGAPNTEHASIVDKYTPDKIQLRHKPGLQESGVGPKLPGQSKKNLYNAGTGDPKAQYGFFGKSISRARESYYAGIRQAVQQSDFKWAVFNWLVRVSPPKWGINKR